MILQHKLSPYFHRSKYYGIHVTCQRKKIAKMIPKAIQRNSQWIKQLFELLTTLFNLVEEEIKSCPECGSINLEKSIISADGEWLKNNVKAYFSRNKDPTTHSENRIRIKRA